MGWSKDNIPGGADESEPQGLRKQRIVAKEHDWEEQVKLHSLQPSHPHSCLPPFTPFGKEQQRAGAVGSSFSDSGFRPF